MKPRRDRAGGVRSVSGHPVIVLILSARGTQNQPSRAVSLTKTPEFIAGCGIPRDRRSCLRPAPDGRFRGIVRRLRPDYEPRPPWPLGRARFAARARSIAANRIRAAWYCQTSCFLPGSCTASWFAAHSDLRASIANCSGSGSRSDRSISSKNDMQAGLAPGRALQRFHHLRDRNACDGDDRAPRSWFVPGPERRRRRRARTRFRHAPVLLARGRERARAAATSSRPATRVVARLRRWSCPRDNRGSPEHGISREAGRAPHRQPGSGPGVPCHRGDPSPDDDDRAGTRILRKLGPRASTATGHSRRRRRETWPRVSSASRRATACSQPATETSQEIVAALPGQHEEGGLENVFDVLLAVEKAPANSHHE